MSVDIDWAARGWNARLRDQLDWHYSYNLRRRLEGLTDEEYLWEPAPDSWSIRPRSEAATSHAAGTGELVLDYAWPEPVPAPLTTIAWRIAHVVVGCLAERTGNHFGGEPTDYGRWTYAATADEAIAQLGAAYAAWTAGVESLGEDGLERPCGPAEGPFAEAPLADLVLHINRELIHHGAEICLMRDLYAQAR
ncbi:MAG: DinB family protein [Nocardioides sp.]